MEKNKWRLVTQKGDLAEKILPHRYRVFVFELSCWPELGLIATALHIICFISDVLSAYLIITVLGEVASTVLKSLLQTLCCQQFGVTHRPRHSLLHDPANNLWAMRVEFHLAALHDLYGFRWHHRIFTQTQHKDFRWSKCFGRWRLTAPYYSRSGPTEPKTCQVAIFAFSRRTRPFVRTFAFLKQLPLNFFAVSLNATGATQASNQLRPHLTRGKSEWGDLSLPSLVHHMLPGSTGIGKLWKVNDDNSRRKKTSYFQSFSWPSSLNNSLHWEHFLQLEPPPGRRL